jgi:predicted nucleic acid-binding protein
MILVDTGPWVALFEPKDKHHSRCVKTLSTVREPLCTTCPVLTEAFHILQPQSTGSDRLRDFIAKGGASVWDLDNARLIRAFELMETYRDRPMDLADASLIVAAEALETRKIFTIDAGDFQTYRIKRVHRHHAVEIIQ